MCTHGAASRERSCGERRRALPLLHWSLCTRSHRPAAAAAHPPPRRWRRVRRRGTVLSIAPAALSCWRLSWWSCTRGPWGWAPAAPGRWPRPAAGGRAQQLRRSPGPRRAAQRGRWRRRGRGRRRPGPTSPLAALTLAQVRPACLRRRAAPAAQPAAGPGGRTGPRCCRLWRSNAAAVVPESAVATQGAAIGCLSAAPKLTARCHLRPAGLIPGDELGPPPAFPEEEAELPGLPEGPAWEEAGAVPGSTRRGSLGGLELVPLGAADGEEGEEGSEASGAAALPASSFTQRSRQVLGELRRRFLPASGAKRRHPSQGGLAAAPLSLDAVVAGKSRAEAARCGSAARAGPGRLGSG